MCLKRQKRLGEVDMTEFKIIRDGKYFTLDITDIKHIFVSEDETCAEIQITKNDLKKLIEINMAGVS